jgi:PAS domain S-box-containing protein
MDTVCLLLHSPRHRQILGQWLENHYAVIEACHSLPPEPFDLLVVDGAQFEEHRTRILICKLSAEPVLLPVLLLTTRRHIDRLPGDTWEVADEVAAFPLLRTELLVRLEALRRTRLLSIGHQRCLQVAQDLPNRRVDGDECRTMLEVMLDSLPMGAFMVTAPDATIVAASKYDRERCGEWTGFSAFDRASKEGWSKAGTHGYACTSELPLYRALMQKELVISEEWVQQTALGTHMVALVNACPVLDDSGESIGAIQTWQDMTACKRNEDTLRYQLARYRAIFANLAEGLIIVDGDGIVVEVNLALYRQYAASSDFVNHDYREAVRYLNIFDLKGRELPLEGWPLTRILRGETIDGLLVRIQFRATGKEHFVLTSGAPVQQGSRLGLAVLAVRDVTELIKAEEELTNERNFVEAVLTSQGTLIAILDVDGTILGVNPACEQLLGYALAEVRGKVLFDFLCPSSRAAARKQHEKVRHATVPLESENYIVRKNGERRFVRWRNTALRDETGEITHIIATGLDITDRIESEEHIKRLHSELQQHAADLENANRELEAFSYSVSHDLRTPLNVISGFSGILADHYAGQLDEQGRKYVERIALSARKMNTLINDMLSLSRISRQELSYEDIDLSALVSSFLCELQASEPDRMVKVIVPQGITVRADGRLMHVAIENLLRNAWKFTSRNPEAKIEFGTTQAEAARVYFIQDNGAGFDMNFAEKLFQPFQRLHSEKEFGGTGVGLATVQRVIARHGGRIWAQAEVDKGATLFFTI